MGEKRFNGFLVDSEDLIRWYERRPDSTTHRYDHVIAAELGWFPLSRVEGRGDGKRVGNVRAHIDKCQCFFAEYSFGTKRGRTGRHTSRLRKKGDSGQAAGVLLHLGEQAGRIIQADDYHKSELANRALPLLRDLQEDLVALGDTEKAFCVQDMLRDIEQFGTITQRTLSEARRLGIPIPGGFA